MTNPLDGNGVCKRCRGSGDISLNATCPDCDGTGRSPAPSHTAVEPVALAYSGECIDIAREAFDAWASKPHNKRWFKRIDGTPIINDIIVNMAVTFGAHGVIAKRAPSDLMVPLSALTAQAAALEAAERERDEARQIVRDIYWMAVRYADGRKSYAPSMCNDALRKAYDAGWLVYRDDKQHDLDPQYARDGDRPEYRSVEARAEAAESEAATLKARIAELEAGLKSEREAIAQMLTERARLARMVIETDCEPEARIFEMLAREILSNQQAGK